MEITEPHILLRDEPFAVFLLSFIKKRRGEKKGKESTQTWKLQLHDNLSQHTWGLYQVSSKFLSNPEFIVPRWSVLISGHLTPKRKKEQRATEESSNISSLASCNSGKICSNILQWDQRCFIVKIITTPAPEHPARPRLRYYYSQESGEF